MRRWFKDIVVLGVALTASANAIESSASPTPSRGCDAAALAKEASAVREPRVHTVTHRVRDTDLDIYQMFSATSITKLMYGALRDGQKIMALETEGFTLETLAGLKLEFFRKIDTATGEIFVEITQHLDRGEVEFELRTSSRIRLSTGKFRFGERSTAPEKSKRSAVAIENFGMPVTFSTEGRISSPDDAEPNLIIRPQVFVGRFISHRIDEQTEFGVTPKLLEEDGVDFALKELVVNFHNPVAQFGKSFSLYSFVTNLSSKAANVVGYMYDESGSISVSYATTVICLDKSHKPKPWTETRILPLMFNREPMPE